MKPWLKPMLYLVLSLLAIWMSVGFYSNFNRSTDSVAPPPTGEAEVEIRPRQYNSAAQGKMMLDGAVLLGCVIGLGLLLSKDLSGWFGDKTTELIYNDNLEGVHNPDYDRAEEVALSGDPMEAVNLLRAFLKKNPREIYAQIRIAELYENDLQNPLASALEYEDVLKHKFNSDRWGWAAIHLVNLYSGRLGKPDQALAWLKRIESEHPETGPAKKARERLTDSGHAPTTSLVVESPKPNQSAGLPPGFSPKKR
jgi:tetratricopeptide (TPR) repeat protein